MADTRSLSVTSSSSFLTSQLPSFSSSCWSSPAFARVSSAAGMASVSSCLLAAAAILPERQLNPVKLRCWQSFSCTFSLPKGPANVTAALLKCKFESPEGVTILERQLKPRCLHSQQHLTNSDQKMGTLEALHEAREAYSPSETCRDGKDRIEGGSVGEEENYWEVSKIVGSRVVGRSTEYLIEWKEDHPDSWEPAANIAQDLIGEYERPWWQASRKADEKKLAELLLDEGRNVDAIDENERTALLFASGLGSERCVRMLVDAGSDVDWQDKDGFTAIHIAAGYAHLNVVRLLLQLGADPDLEDLKGRSALGLAKELLERTPKANPIHFSRRLTLDQIIKLLDETLYETLEVEQVLDKRLGESGSIEYLVKWRDGSELSWVHVGDVGEDLVRDYEAGLEYSIAEKILERRLRDGEVEYLVQWADSEKNTWEPAGNIATEVIAEFENPSSTKQVNHQSVER